MREIKVPEYALAYKEHLPGAWFAAAPESGPRAIEHDGIVFIAEGAAEVCMEALEAHFAGHRRHLLPSVIFDALWNRTGTAEKFITRYFVYKANGDSL